MNTPETTRCTCRCALAAAPAVVAASAATQAQSPREDWQSTLREYLRLKAEFETLPTSDKVALDALYEKFSPLEDRLLAMSAPDLRAVEWKLQYWRRECEMFELEPRHFNSLIDDVQRLSV